MSDSDRPAGASSTGLVRDALREGRSERSVLMIAFHFPPVQGSSGWQRCLRFAQHLPRYGWRPVILTVHARAYEARSAESIAGVPEGLEVHRAFGLDTARHLSLWGRYPRFLAQPDRWATWKYLAVPTALRLIRRLRIDLLWSTFPIATAHQIGLEVARKSGVPWIAEFRDPMWQGDYPPDPVINSAWKQLEQQVFQQAAATVVTTPGARQLYERRFTAAIGCPPPALIENGYDEGTFRAAEARLAATPAGAGGTERPVVLLHSGIVYRSERDPSQLFKAVAALRQAGRISAARLQIVFRACGDEAGYRRLRVFLPCSDDVGGKPRRGAPLRGYYWTWQINGAAPPESVLQ